ncbi:MAG: PAS domain S-box protein [Thermodesulfobacteriota bacterium]|nr:PAS domain S-box protein [Thermodesulfobacteriota bacterium]
MSRETKTKVQLLEEIDVLERRLEETEEALKAIRSGEVDAIYVEGPKGERLFTLKGADQTYRTLVEDMHQGAVTSTADGTILYANKAFAEMTQRPPGSIVGSSIGKYIAPEDKGLFEALFQQGIQEGAGGEMALHVEKGFPVPVYLSVNRVSSDGATLLCIAITDLRDQKRQEEVVKSERLSRAILEAAGEAVLVCDHDGRIVRANHAARELVQGPLLLKSFDDTFSLETLPKTNREAAGSFSVFPVLKGDAFYGIEVLLRKEKSESCDLLLSATPLRSEEGIVGCVLLLTDTTALKQLERDLEAERERLAVTLLSIGDGVIVTDLEGQIQLINRVAESLTGWSHGEAKGRSLDEVFHIISEKTRRPCENPVKKVLASGVIVGLANDSLLISKDGAERAVADSGSPILSRNGNIVGVVLVFRDVTKLKEADKALRRAHEELEERVEERTAELVSINEKLKREIEDRKQAQQALKQSEERLREVNVALDRGLSEVFQALRKLASGDPSVRISETSELDLLVRLKRAVNATAQDLATIINLTHEFAMGLAEYFDVLQRVSRGDFSARVSGDSPVELLGALKRDINHMILGISTEIAERQRAEQALQKSEAELRHLSARLLQVQEAEREKISRELHDSIGQALAATKFGVENCLHRIRELADEETAKSLEALVPVVQRASEEVRQIHTDLRPSLLDDLGIIATISWFCREFQGLYGGLTIEQQIDVEEKQVADALKIVIFRLLQEALNNVAKYGKGDRVRVSLQERKGHIELAIKDNGRGFNVDEAFSTKSLKGGFGLTSMKERTELSGGSFFIESAPKTGTLVRATWPLRMTEPT